MYNLRRRKSKLQQIKALLIKRYALLFPDPVETRLLQVLGGSTLTIGAVRRSNKPMTITLSRGRLLRSERFRRSALNGCGVLANDIQMAIQIEGKDYERKVVEMYERDEKLREQGWYVRYIPERWLYNNPERVKQVVGQFLYS